MNGEKKNAFEWLNEKINELEYSAINLVSSVAPWLAPLLPAYLTHKHVTEVLSYGNTMGFIAALVVEFLGLATVSTTLTFWNHNKKYSAPDRVAPFEWALGAFGFYLLTVLVTNGVLEFYVGSESVPVEVRVAASILFTLLSVPAAVTVAIRAIYKEKLAKINEKRTPAAKLARKLQNELRAANKRIDRLQAAASASEALQADFSALQGEYKQAQAEAQSLQAESKKLQAELHAMQAESEAVQAAAKRLQVMNPKFQAAAGYLAEEFETLQAAADFAECDASTISRIAKSMNGHKEN